MADNPVRRAQLITTFGVGAMVDFPRDQSWMVAGLDAWPFARQACPSEWIVTEERLQARLGVSHFRLPADHRKPAPGVRHANQHIPFVRFPRWHYCPREGVMQYLPLFGGARERCPCGEGLRCTVTPSSRRPFLMPVRLVAACERGHIQDFPFLEWVHNETPGEGHQLRYVPGRSSASLANIGIECSCGKKRSLAGAFDYDATRGGPLHRLGLDCSAHRPWLGESDGPTADAPEGTCGLYLRALQRGASNVYFSQTFSSIYLPLWGENTDPDVIQALEDVAVWQTLSEGLDQGRYISQDRCEIVARLRQIDADALRAAAQRRLEGAVMPQPVTEEEYRRSEYEAFRDGRGDPNTDLAVDVREGSEFNGLVRDMIRRVCLVRKLRETRALAGFSRVFPPAGNDVAVLEEDEGAAVRHQIQPLSLDQNIGWLPAIVVRGEGMFLEFDLEKIEAWSSQASPSRRIANMVQAYNGRRVDRLLPERRITPKFILLHTLAHMLIRQLSFECGYGSASLRERIYCEASPDSSPMQGILIYTASGDSEGTMGGLVRQGEPGRLENTLHEAIRLAGWCSSDPVCIESTGQGSENANLAACHGCVLLSETSCEEGNRLLDRALVVGSLDNPACGLFSSAGESA